MKNGRFIDRPSRCIGVLRAPATSAGLSIDELSSKLRGEHRATLLAVTRDGRSLTNPPADFRLQPGDDAVVVAESLGELEPLKLQHA